MSCDPRCKPWPYKVPVKEYVKIVWLMQAAQVWLGCLTHPNFSVPPDAAPQLRPRAPVVIFMRLISSVKSFRDLTLCALRRPLIRTLQETRAINLPYQQHFRVLTSQIQEPIDMATKEGKSNKLSFQLKTPKGTRDCKLRGRLPKHFY